MAKTPENLKQLAHEWDATAFQASKRMDRLKHGGRAWTREKGVAQFAKMTADAYRRQAERLEARQDHDSEEAQG